MAKYTTGSAYRICGSVPVERLRQPFVIQSRHKQNSFLAEDARLSVVCQDHPPTLQPSPHTAAINHRRYRSVRQPV